MEVEHLQRLQHRHIVRLVGTYTFKRDLAILIYPATQWNLDEFMDELIDPSKISSISGKLPLITFFGCLANALHFIHQHNVKHMDIKPANLLVRRTGQDYRIYIADFGIARAYKSAEEASTDSPTSFTRIYAAPEVVMQEIRGFPADIFSLGCVFVEMLATLASTQNPSERAKLAEIRAAQRDDSFHANLEAVLAWYEVAIRYEVDNRAQIYPWADPSPLHVFCTSCPGLIHDMLKVKPEERPSSETVQLQIIAMQSVMSYYIDYLLCKVCTTCNDGPEPFEAAEALSEESTDRSTD